MIESLTNSFACSIIAKDEENVIEGALSSVEQVCSQIVVVDTGSTDSTATICTRFGADVHFFKWNGSFSEARNYSLQFINKEWIIALDADEMLDLPSLQNFIKSFKAELNIDVPHLLGMAHREHLYLSETPTFAGKSKHGEIGGINVIIENYLGKDDMSLKTRHRYTRIFRNDVRIRYEGNIHEQIRHSIEKAGYSIVDSEIIIRHYGYGKDRIEKSLRNKILLTSELEQKPNDVFLKYHLAETEFAMNNFDKAEELFLTIYSNIESISSRQSGFRSGKQLSEGTVDVPHLEGGAHLAKGVEYMLLSQQQVEMIRLRLAQIALSKNEYANVEKYLNFESDDIDREGFRKFILAASFMVQHKFAEASILYNSTEVRQSSMADKSIIENALRVLRRQGYD